MTTSEPTTATVLNADSTFDPATYWNRRLQQHSPLKATGTLGFDDLYQPWLYRLKEVAIRRVLRPLRSKLRGARVLNVGCGYGYFEPVFAAYGAAHVTGIDFVALAVEALRTSRPQFAYGVADITQSLPAFLQQRSFDLVTAIDVLYHVVDEAAFAQAVRNLCSLCRPDGGLLLFTDAPGRAHEGRQSHCRYRNWRDYGKVFEDWGVSLSASTPMYCFFDTYTSWSERLARHPRIAYPLMYAWDRMLAPRGWRATSNHCALAVRHATGGEGPT